MKIKTLILATALMLSCIVVIAQDIESPLTGIKSSFSGGEFAPSLYSRVDLAKYATGARTLRNFIVHPHGGISNRPGLEYIATARTADKAIRLLPFEFSTTQTYVIEMGESHARFYADGEAITIDAADTYAKLLWHCDGTDGDQGNQTATTGQTVTTIGTAQIDDAQSVFGGESILLDGNSDYCTVPDHANWDFGSGDFTIDFRIRFNALSEQDTLLSQLATAKVGWEFYYYEAKLYFGWSIDGTIISDVGTFSWTPSTDTWYHIAIERDGNDLRCYVDGLQIGSIKDITGVTIFNSTDVLAIGAGSAGENFFDGWLEEIRISKGIARWTSNFSLPIAAYDLSGGADAWVTATSYITGDFVTESSTVYRCLETHTSGTFATDLAAAYWVADNIYSVATPYLEDDLADLQYTQSADVLYLTHPDYAPRQLERAGTTDWSLNLYDYENGPFQLSNTDTAKTLRISALTGLSADLTVSGTTLNSLQVGSLFKLRHYIEGQADTAAITGVGEETEISCGGTWRLITHGTWTGTIRVEKSIDAGVTYTMLREFSSANDYNVSTYDSVFGTEDMSDYGDAFLVRLNATALASGTCNANLTTDPYYQEGIVKVTSVATNGLSAIADIERTCGLTTTTSDWSESSWSNYRGWPAVVEFHPEDRLVFGNSATEPYTYWMTRTGNYTDFSRSSPLQDDDGISSPLPGRKVNGINGLIVLGEMIALTLANEVSIRSDSGPITPTTVMNKVHGWEGSYGIKPVVIGNRAIYVQSTGSIIRDLGYDLSSDTFVGADLTIFSNHLFEGDIITELAYQQNPDRIIWAIRDDGILLSMTYMREQEVVAWTWHDTNDGDDLFESVCTIRGSGYDEVWLAVNRDGTRYVERMVQRMASTDLDDQFFVDCGISGSLTTAGSIYGLEHLEGKTVAILNDGVVEDQQVVANGLVTLTSSPTTVTTQVGLPYNADLETLNVEVNLPDGTAQGRKIHMSNVVLRMLNTQSGYIGRDSDNLFSLNLESRADYDEDALFSGDHSLSLGAGYAEGGRLFYRQSDPLPVTITGLIPTVTVGGTTHVR